MGIEAVLELQGCLPNSQIHIPLAGTMGNVSQGTLRLLREEGGEEHPISAALLKDAVVLDIDYDELYIPQDSPFPCIAGTIISFS